ncbi:MAG: hypothetical protein ACYCUJ_09960 [Acidithiobacillus sp.]
MNLSSGTSCRPLSSFCGGQWLAVSSPIAAIIDLVWLFRVDRNEVPA